MGRTQFGITLATPMLKLRYIDLLRTCCTTCCTTNPQQIWVMEFERMLSCINSHPVSMSMSQLKNRSSIETAGRIMPVFDTDASVVLPHALLCGNSWTSKNKGCFKSVPLKGSAAWCKEPRDDFCDSNLNTMAVKSRKNFHRGRIASGENKHQLSTRRPLMAFLFTIRYEMLF